MLRRVFSSARFAFALDEVSLADEYFCDRFPQQLTTVTRMQKTVNRDKTRRCAAEQFRFMDDNFVRVKPLRVRR